MGLQSINYINKTQENYRIAISYYTAKRAQFANYLIQNEIQGLELFKQEQIKAFVNSFKNFQQDIINKASTNIDNTQTMSFTHEEKTINLGMTYADISTTILKDKASGIRKFGPLFEIAFAQYFSDLSQKFSHNLSNFISQRTGEIVQEGFTFQGKRQIRSDVTLGNVQNIKDTQMEISIDMQDRINEIMNSDLNVTQRAENIIGLMKNQGYLSDTNVIAGFSLKNYSDNIAYTHSEKLKNSLNKEYQKFPPASNNEAYTQMMYYLSKYLIAITSPNIVGLISYQGLEWMDDVLEKYRYIFHIRTRTRAKEEEKFWIENSAIYLQKQNVAAKMSRWNVRGKKTGLITLNLNANVF